MEDGLVSPRTEGTPQGGPLSPLLSNILLDELDGSWSDVGTDSSDTPTTATCTCGRRRRASGCWHRSSGFLAERLRLKVNRDKSAVERPWDAEVPGLQRHVDREAQLKVPRSPSND